jgi:hypothetical protein
MVDLDLDVKRLTLIHEMPIALESMAVTSHLKDFVHYYFTRFITNITQAFKDFTGSEIADFNHRHTEVLARMFKRPTLRLEGIVVPIPRGMIQPYNQTLTSLMTLLTEVKGQELRKDMDALVAALSSQSVKGLSTHTYTKDQFDHAKVSIGKLFGKVGLTHATAEFFMVDKDSIKATNDKLLQLTEFYYPDLIAINETVKTLEEKYYQFTGGAKDRYVISQQFMTMAYRLSILATVMDQIQMLEHSFVGSLDTVLKKQ